MALLCASMLFSPEREVGNGFLGYGKIISSPYVPAILAIVVTSMVSTLSGERFFITKYANPLISGTMAGLLYWSLLRLSQCS